MKKIVSVFLALFFAMTMLNAQQRDHKNAFKTTFLSFYTGSAKLTYERAVKLGQSFEITGGGIGLGYDSFGMKPKGALFRFAYKFIFFPQEHFLLNGLYLKPELAISCFSYDAVEAVGRKMSNMGTLMACVGYQWAKKIFIAEGFVGMGVGYGNDSDYEYHHGFVDRFGWLTFTFGLKVGFTFGNKSTLL
ncbi:MAG: hypothetical protein RR356_07610 [Bacteroidales bacterium]